MDWFYPHEVEPDLEGGFYYEEAHANRNRRRRYSDFAQDIAWRAAKAGAKHLLQKGFNKLKEHMTGKSRQDAIMDDARKKARKASGRLGKPNNVTANAMSIKPAMFLSGRGAEIPLVMNGFQKPISLNLGLKGASYTDPRKAIASAVTYSSKAVSSDFAFKAIKSFVLPLVNEGSVQNSRVGVDTTWVTTHVFRHKDPRSMSKTLGPTFSEWNITLGADPAFNRKAPPVGTAITVPTGFVDDFISAERFPPTLKDMVPRYSIESLEQDSWNLNPMKIVSGTTFEQDGVGSSMFLTPASPLYYIPRAQPLYTMANSQAPAEVLENISPLTPLNYGPQIFQSIPASQQYKTDTSWYSTPNYGSVPVEQTNKIPVSKEDGYFKVQMGKATLNYNFSNNGTVPVVVDLVVTRLAKGGVIYDNANFTPDPDPATSQTNQRHAWWVGLRDQVADGFKTKTVGLQSSVGQGGQWNQAYDAIYGDMKQEFLPEKFFKSGKPPTRYSPSLEVVKASETIPGPKYVFVARDQFIISPGGSKPWSTTLPSLSYDARKYRNFDPDMSGLPGPPSDVEIDVPFANRVVYDDRAYALSWRISNVAVPMAEASSTVPGDVAVIERGATDINVTCNGSYTEHPAPCFKVGGSKVLFNHGQLASPFYTNENEVPHVSHIDIANTGQAIRSQDEASAYTQVGATTSSQA